MDNEASKTTTLAITVIALAVFVVVGFGIFSYARSSLNTGNDKLNSALSTVNDSDFQDYNQKKVSGTKVLSCLNDFEGSPVAILIQTTNLAKACFAYDDATETFTYSVAPSEIDTSKFKDVNDNAKKFFVPAQGEKMGYRVFINYNAILDTGLTVDAGKVAAPDAVPTGEGATLQMKDGVYTFSGQMLSANGNVLMNKDKANLSRTGMTEYISGSTYFQANLIKDTTKTNIGVAFEQLN